MESVSGADGSELKLQAYDPFGERRSGDWTRALTDIERKSLAGEAPQRTARGYTGHEHLERTGLIHMNGRVYDPVIGRFLSPDPVVADASFSQSWNAYSYALNSPLSYSDPSGTVVASGCPPSLCAGGGFGGGGFGPGTVLATSAHFSARLVIRSGLDFGLPTNSRPQVMLNIQDSSSATGGGSRGGQRLEDRRSGRYPWSRSRSVVLVRGQLINEPVGIGEEQSPADLPMDVLESAALDIAQAVIGLAGLIPVVGNVADGINAGISVARGNYQDAILDGASAVPGTGQFTGAAMAGIRANRAMKAIWKAAMARGRLNEARVLKDLGLEKNTKRVHGKEGYSIPDALTETELIEIKDVKSISMTRQLRIQSEWAKKNKLRAVLYVGQNTKHVHRVEKYFEVKRLPYLGPSP